MSADYWRQNSKLQHITPPNNQWPEGDWIRGLQGLIGGWFPNCEQIREMGCGYGRIASLLTPERYTGFDINPVAIEAARRFAPGRKFVLDKGQDLPKGGLWIVWTVGLHIPDGEAPGFFDRIAKAADAVLIAEIMDTGMRRGGNPPVFNRNPSGYRAIMKHCGMVQAFHETKPYPHYPGREIDLLGFVHAEHNSR